MTAHHWKDPHVIRSVKTFLKTFYISIGVFLLLFVSAHIGGALYISRVAEKSAEAFQTGIKQDLAYLKNQGNAVAQNPLVITYLLNRDSEKLIETLQKEKAARNIGLMGVADSDGFIVGRTKDPGTRGDNVFLTNVIGRAVAEGKYAESVESPVGFDPAQLYLTTGRPLIHQGQMVGALFANYLTDNDYATIFRDTYLPPGVEILFYTKGVGVYGNSFSDPETRQLIHSYFNAGSDWLQNGDSGKTIAFNDGGFYLIENIVFPGLEQSPGGAILFIPRPDISQNTNLIIASLTLLIFIILTLKFHKRTRGEERTWRYYVLIVLASLPIFAFAFFGFYFQRTGFLRLERVPYILYNSTLRLQPEFGVYEANLERTLTIFADAGDEPINAVELGLLFDPEMIEVQKLETVGSACAYVIENKIDVPRGRADLSCAILPPGRTGNSLKIADLTIIPKRAGTFTIAFDTNTRILANDGLGTNVLRAAQSGSYSIPDPNQVADPEKPMIVFSPTHPNQSRWYNASRVRLVWNGPAEGVYYYAFDNSPQTIPSKMHTQGSKIELPIPGDGIFYFHLKPAQTKQVIHYRLRSDLTAPEIISINLSADKIKVGDVVRFYFEVEDAGSGVQQNYYVDLGSRLFLPSGSQLFVPFLEKGNQKLILRVYDGAGNYSEKSKIIHVESRK